MKTTKPETLINQGGRDSDGPVASRRGFLMGASLGAAGAVAVAVSGGVDSIGLEGNAQEEKKQSGYRLTPHIAHYYRTTQM